MARRNWIVILDIIEAIVKGKPIEQAEAERAEKAAKAEKALQAEIRHDRWMRRNLIWLKHRLGD